jgi:PAS domain S-box-containing protein
VTNSDQGEAGLYRDMVRDAPLGIFRSSPEGRFLEANQALAEMLGYATPAL